MKYYRFPDSLPVKIGMPLLLLALQLVARNTMYSSTFLGFAASQAIMIGLVAVIGLLFLAVNRKDLKQIVTDRRVALLIGSAAVILLPMAVKQDWQMMYFSILICWLFAVFVTYFTTVSELGRVYVLIMTGLSVLSLVGIFVLKPMVHGGLIPGNPFDSPGGWHMYNFGLTFVCDTNNGFDDTLRAFGIFREPGLYACFLFPAIHLNNYAVRWDKQWKMWAVDGILFVSLMTTFATAGVLALGLYIVFLFFDKGLYKNRKLRFLAVLAVVLGIGLLIWAVSSGGTWAYELIGMVEKIYNRTYSYTARVDSIVSNAGYFLENPLFGGDMREVLYAVPSNTATSTIIFAVLGILSGCIHVLSWAAFAWKKERHWMMNLILMVILFLPFNTQNVVADMFFWLFPMMALTEGCLEAMDRIHIGKKVR